EDEPGWPSSMAILLVNIKALSTAIFCRRPLTLALHGLDGPGIGRASTRRTSYYRATRVQKIPIPIILHFQSLVSYSDPTCSNSHSGAMQFSKTTRLLLLQS